MRKYQRQIKRIHKYKKFFFFSILLILTVLALPIGILVTQKQNQSNHALAATATSTLGGCQVFPANSVWNTDISSLPVNPNSTTYVNTIGANSPLLNDFNATNTFPYTIVSGSQPFVPVTLQYGVNPSRAPVPTNAPIESNSSDHHLLVTDSGNCHLYEFFAATIQADGSVNAYSGGQFDLTTNVLRGPLPGPDAAALPMTPLLVRYDEVSAGAINHALRFTVPQANVNHVWPAFGRGNYTGTQYPPMGQRFRLKVSVDISHFSQPIQVILTALKHYGMFVADETDPQYAWSLGGAPDPGWNNVNLSELQQIHGSDFEAVDESSLIVDPNSGEVVGGPQPTPPANGGIWLRGERTGNTGAGGATLTISQPPGVQSGDVLIAHVIVQTAGNTVTPPSGWTLIKRQDSLSSMSTATYYKVAGASEPSTYSWTFSTAGEASGGIADYSGVDTTNPIDASNAQFNQSTASTDNAGVTTTTANDMLVYTIGVATQTLLNVPDTFTEEWRSNSNTATTSDMSQELFPTPGATGLIHGTQDGGTSSNITHLIALRPAPQTATPTSQPVDTLTPTPLPTNTPTPSTSGITIHGATSANNGTGSSTLTINKPVGTQSEDVMVAHIVVRIAGNTITVPSGWNQILRQDSSSSISSATYWKLATTNEPTSYTWSFGTAGEASGGIASYTGVNTTSPIDASHAQYNVTTNNVDNSGVTTTVPNDMLVYAVAITVATTVNDPSGFTKEWSTTNNSSTTSEMSQELSPTAGATGTIHGTHNGGTNSNITFLIALKPANSLTLTPTPTPIPDTIAPTVAITNPTDGSTVKRGSTVTITATASDNVGVTQVVFTTSNGASCTDTTAPYSCSWSVPGKRNVTYTLTAKAYDAAGNTASSSVTVTAK